MTARDVEARRAHARSFLEAAEMLADDPASTNVVGSIAVLAGIAASDAICGRALGERSSSDDHAAAVAFLERVEGAKTLASALGRLLSEKNKTQYSAALLAPGRARDMLGWAKRLVDGIPD